MNANQPVSSAKVAISALVQVLQFCGVHGLDPETVRQAKFNGASASAPLWRALHDLILVHLADYSFEGAGEALRKLWSEVDAEQLATDDDILEGTPIPQEGSDMVLHYLKQWGCPPRLFGALQSPNSASPRHLLLTLTWLVAKGHVFPRALQALGQAIPDSMALLLPPFPEDTSLATHIQGTYVAAVQEAQAHVARTLQHVNSLLPASTSSIGAGPGNRTRNPLQGSPFDPDPDEQQTWVAVEAAAHATLTLMGRVRARLSALNALEDGRHKLQVAVREASHAAGSTSSSGPASGSVGLSGYEVWLASSPKALEEAVEALAASTKTLDDVLQLASAARLYFQWAGSVLELELKEIGTVGAPGAASQAQSAIPPMPALLQLPDASSTAAARLLAAQEDALRGALAEAQPTIDMGPPPPPVPTGAARYAMYGQSSSTRGRAVVPVATPPAPEVSILSFRTLAQQALTASAPEASQQAHPVGDNARMGVEQVGGTDSGAWQPPRDVAAGLAGAKNQDAEASEAAAVAARSLQLLRVGSLPRTHVVAAGAQSHQKGAAQLPHGALGAVEETGRLLDAALAVARNLARTRAGNKHALQAALADLPESFHVINA